MENVLIVSSGEKSIVFFSEILRSFLCNKIAVVSSCSEARQILLEKNFDLVIINAPLKDESGEGLAQHIASKSMVQVILAVKSEYYDDISSIVEDYGVITVSKPLSRNFFWSALKLAKAAQNKLRTMQIENNKLIQKIEDIRIVNRAKCILISYLNISEDEAHRYIEKQAMDMRITKRSVSEGILKTYEN